MTTRRDALKTTAGTCLAAIGFSSAASASIPAPESTSFDVEEQRMLWAMMIVQAGVEPGSEACSALWEHFYGIAPLPAEYDPIRQRCRDGLVAVLGRLDDRNPEAIQVLP